MRLHYYPTILLIVAVLDFHNSESARILRKKSKTGLPKVAIAFPPSFNGSGPGNEPPKTLVIDLPPPDAPSSHHVYDGIEFKYFSAADSDGVAGGGSSGGESWMNNLDNLITEISNASAKAEGREGQRHRHGGQAGSDSDGDLEIDLAKLGLTKAAKKFKALSLIFAGLGTKLILKLLVSFLPNLVTLPAFTTLSFLAGVLFGRLSAGLINPPATPAPVVAPVTTATTTTTTTTTPAPGGTSTASLFFATNLGGGGATLTATIGMCIDFPPMVDKMVQSVDTMGNCVLLCDMPGCVGTCYRFTGATVINDLGSFNNMASSITLC